MLPCIRGRETSWPPRSGQLGDYRGLKGQVIQRACTLTNKILSFAKRRHQRIKWRWQKWLERRQYQCAQRSEKQKVSKEDTRENTLKSQARLGETPTVSVQRKETAPDANAVGEPVPSTGVQDHMLLVVKAVVNGTSVSTLIDSGASRSFVSDRLQCRPRLQFVGAYSALELVNGETIVSTGIAPQVLVCIGSIPCQLSLTAVPMMEGIQLILGKDWLDIMNPLVDWQSNMMWLRNGQQLEPIEGIRVKFGNVGQIVDKGLPGLQHTLGILKGTASTPTIVNWGDKLKKLYLP